MKQAFYLRPSFIIRGRSFISNSLCFVRSDFTKESYFLPPVCYVNLPLADELHAFCVFTCCRVRPILDFLGADADTDIRK